MILLEFKNLLNSKNIFLFDSFYRIAFHRIHTLNNLIFKKSYNNELYYNPFYFIKNETDASKIKYLINEIIDNNYDKCLKIIKF